MLISYQKWYLQNFIYLATYDGVSIIWVAIITKTST